MVTIIDSNRGMPSTKSKNNHINIHNYHSYPHFIFSKPYSLIFTKLPLCIVVMLMALVTAHSLCRLTFGLAPNIYMISIMSYIYEAPARLFAASHCINYMILPLDINRYLW